MSEESEAATGLAQINWGLVPTPVLRLMQIFTAKVNTANQRLETLDWNRDGFPSDAAPFFIEQLSASQLAIDAATDLRALTTAYAQVFHQPRPTLARLAEAQGSSSAGLIKRYTPNTVDAITELLSEKPDPNVVARAFRSVGLRDLSECSPAMKREIDRVRSEPANRRRSSGAN